MKLFLVAITLLGTSMGTAQFGRETPFSEPMQEKDKLRKPEFYVLDWPKGTQLIERETQLTIEVDSMGTQPVKMIVDIEGTTVLYSSDISTPVCADGDCRLMDIRLYWTLLGDYAGFDHYQESPLTKHDHDEFVYGDYLKLHQLLLDDNSILKRRRIDELVKKPVQPEEEGVDAIAGATIKEVKESVVSGALYSCYTAWHLVHGAIKEKLRRLTISTLDEGQLLKMLMTENADYQMFVLKRFSSGQYEQHYLRIADIFANGIPLVRTFIVKNLPHTFWKSEEFQRPFWENFAKVDINTQSLLLEHLSEAPASVVRELSNDLGVMTKNQLKGYLEYLIEKQPIDSSIIDNLKVFSKRQNETNAYLVSYFLEDYEL